MAQAVEVSNLPEFLGDWAVDDVILATESEPSLRSRQAVRTIRRHHVDGNMLRQDTFPCAIVNEMYESKLKRRKFLSTVSKWKTSRDRIINIRTSDGKTCTLSQTEFAELSLRMTVQDIQHMAEAKLNAGFGPVVFRHIRKEDRREHQLVEDNSLARNQISWGATIFIDTSPKTLAHVDGLPSDRIVTSGAFRDMITGEPPSPEFPLLKMNCCGEHSTISAYSMSLHIRDSMRRCQFELYCPRYECRKPWTWELCMRAASLSIRETREIESKRVLNQENMTDPTKKCPHCEGPVSRPLSYKMARVRCLGCRGPEFCWRCLGRWTGSGACGNPGCPTEILLNCETTDRWASQHGPVPKLRACPRCDGIMEYRKACQHIMCPTCSFEFCLICLRNWKGHSSSSCSLAPRQRM